MARHNEVGKKGEVLAAASLKAKGFTLLHCNWRYSHHDIDIIALKESVLHLLK